MQPAILTLQGADAGHLVGLAHKRNTGTDSILHSLPSSCAAAPQSTDKSCLAKRFAHFTADYVIVKCASADFMSLTGVMSWGHAENTTMRSISARSDTCCPASLVGLT